MRMRLNDEIDRSQLCYQQLRWERLCYINAHGSHHRRFELSRLRDGYWWLAEWRSTPGELGASDQGHSPWEDLVPYSDLDPDLFKPSEFTKETGYSPLPNNQDLRPTSKYIQKHSATFVTASHSAYMYVNLCLFVSDRLKRNINVSSDYIHIIITRCITLSHFLDISVSLVSGSLCYLQGPTVVASSSTLCNCWEECI